MNRGDFLTAYMRLEPLHDGDQNIGPVPRATNLDSWDWQIGGFKANQLLSSRRENCSGMSGKQ